MTVHCYLNRDGVPMAETALCEKHSRDDNWAEIADDNERIAEDRDASTFDPDQHTITIREALDNSIVCIACGYPNDNY